MNAGWGDNKDGGKLWKLVTNTTTVLVLAQLCSPVRF
jgi:hypothetical protein